MIRLEERLKKCKEFEYLSQGTPPEEMKEVTKEDVPPQKGQKAMSGEKARRG